MAYGPVNVPGVNHTDLDAVRAAAATAQSAADAARAAAQAAQTTADAAGTAAQKAQQTADTAKTDAGRAQTTADGARTAAVVMGAATGSAAGKAGLVPAPAAGAQGKYLRGDGTWQTPPNTTYAAATQSAAGLMSATDKQKLDGVAAGANAYSLPAASASVRGGVKIGYAANGKNYPVQLSGEQMYVNVPWTDNNTTYGNMGAATASAAGKAGLVPAPAAGAQGKYLRGDGTWQTPPDTNTTYNAATQGAAGLMSAADKKKLDGIAAGANVNTVTGVKGSAESSYRTGQVNITAANVGAAAASHTHSYLPMSGGAVTGYTKIQNLSLGQDPNYTGDGTNLTNTIRSLATGIHLSSAGDSYNVYLHGGAVYCCSFEDSAVLTDFFAKRFLAPDFAIQWLSSGGAGIGFSTNEANPSFVTLYAKNFSSQSAKRYKENFSEITSNEAKKLLELQPQHFDFIDGEKNQSGFIAEDVEPLYPEICSYCKDLDDIDNPNAPVRLQGLDYSKFVPYIVRLLQVQQAEIDAQREEITAMKHEIENLKSASV